MRRRFWLSSGVIFLDETLYAAVVPLLPLYAAHFDLTRIEVGLILAAYPLLMLVSSLPAGILADRFGARQLLAAGCALLIVSTVGFALADTAWQLWATRAVQGLTSGLTSVAGMAVIAGAAGAGCRGTILGFAASLTGLSTFAGPALGGFAVPAIGQTAAFLLPVVLAVVVLAGLLLPGWAEPPRASRRSLRRSVADPLRDPFVRGASVCILVVGFVGGAAQTLAPLRLADAGYSTSDLGVLFLVSAALGLVATPWSGG